MNHLTGTMLAFFILMMSCRSQTQLNIINLTGKPGEVLIVMADDSWQGIPGESCRVLFSRAYEMLPQYEPVFDVAHLNFESFRDFFLLHRNILKVEISDDINEPSLELIKDRPGAYQLMIILRSPDTSSFVQLLAENSERILTLFEQAEIDRIIHNNEQNRDDSLTALIKIRHGLSLTLPEGYEIAIDTTGFTWLQMEDNTVTRGIIAYQLKKDTQEDDLSLEDLIRYRDAVLRQFIAGSVAGSYMTTEKEFPPIMTTSSVDGNSAIIEIKGLWKMMNGISMGGPFISLTRIDGRNQTITTVEGFVFAAGLNKRNYMREQEAILLTIE